MTNSRTIDLEVDVATLRRRLDALEVQFTGNVDGFPGPQPLFFLYSHLLLSGLQPSKDSAALMQSCALLLTPRILLDLARLTGDMFPWRPFLGALDRLQVTGHDVQAATAWVESCARDLLKAQGLGILRIEDVLRSPVGPLHNLKQIALSVPGNAG